MNNTIKCVRILSRSNSEKGYTLVETLVAGAILMGVLIPSTLFLGKVTAQGRSRDLIIASQLASSEMERTMAQGLYENDKRDVYLNNKVWHVSRQIDKHQGLVVVSVQVFRMNQTNPTITMKTLRVESVNNRWE